MAKTAILKKMPFLIITDKAGEDGGIFYCEVCHGTMRAPERFNPDAFTWLVRGFQEMHKPCRKKYLSKKRRDY